MAQSIRIVGREFTSPEELIDAGLAAGSRLLRRWEKRDQPGWHEFEAQKRAGVHASCEGLRLVLDDQLPWDTEDREVISEAVFWVFAAEIYGRITSGARGPTEYRQNFALFALF
jgi:glycine cleavage system aminomethyltransferase T